MIELKNEHSSFQFEIIGYQFPNADDKEYDGNWLMIKINIINDEFKWSKVDPCLFTWEVQEIADWLYSLANNQKLKTHELRFTEPNLGFAYTKIADEKFRISIYFDAELLPPGWDKSKECFIDFELKKTELHNTGKMFENELKRHPVRR
jgi:hypothetical protein